MHLFVSSGASRSPLEGRGPLFPVCPPATPAHSRYSIIFCCSRCRCPYVLARSVLVTYRDLRPFLDHFDFQMPRCPETLGPKATLALLKSGGKFQPASVRPENGPEDVVAGPKENGSPAAGGTGHALGSSDWGQLAGGPECLLGVTLCPQ